MINRRYISTQLRRLARWVDRGPIECIGTDLKHLLPDDIVVLQIFRGVGGIEPHDVPTGWTTAAATEHAVVAYKRAGD